MELSDTTETDRNEGGLSLSEANVFSLMSWLTFQHHCSTPSQSVINISEEQLEAWKDIDSVALLRYLWLCVKKQESSHQLRLQSLLVVKQTLQQLSHQRQSTRQQQMIAMAVIHDSFPVALHLADVCQHMFEQHDQITDTFKLLMQVCNLFIDHASRLHEISRRQFTVYLSKLQLPNQNGTSLSCVVACFLFTFVLCKTDSFDQFQTSPCGSSPILSIMNHFQQLTSHHVSVFKSNSTSPLTEPQQLSTLILFILFRLMDLEDNDIWSFSFFDPNLVLSQNNAKMPAHQIQALHGVHAFVLSWIDFLQHLLSLPSDSVIWTNCPEVFRNWRSNHIIPEDALEIMLTQHQASRLSDEPSTTSVDKSMLMNACKTRVMQTQSSIRQCHNECIQGANNMTWSADTLNNSETVWKEHLIHHFRSVSLFQEVCRVMYPQETYHLIVSQAFQDLILQCPSFPLYFWDQCCRRLEHQSDKEKEDTYSEMLACLPEHVWGSTDVPMYMVFCLATEFDTDRCWIADQLGFAMQEWQQTPSNDTLARLRILFLMAIACVQSETYVKDMIQMHPSLMSLVSFAWSIFPDNMDYYVLCVLVDLTITLLDCRHDMLPQVEVQLLSKTVLNKMSHHAFHSPNLVVQNRCLESMFVLLKNASLFSLSVENIHNKCLQCLCHFLQHFANGGEVSLNNLTQMQQNTIRCIIWILTALWSTPNDNLALGPSTQWTPQETSTLWKLVHNSMGIPLALRENAISQTLTQNINQFCTEQLIQNPGVMQNMLTNLEHLAANNEITCAFVSFLSQLSSMTVNSTPEIVMDTILPCLQTTHAQFVWNLSPVQISTFLNHMIEHVLQSNSAQVWDSEIIQMILELVSILFVRNGCSTQTSPQIANFLKFLMCVALRVVDLHAIRVSFRLNQDLENTNPEENESVNSSENDSDNEDLENQSSDFMQGTQHLQTAIDEAPQITTFSNHMMSDCKNLSEPWQMASPFPVKVCNVSEMEKVISALKCWVNLSPMLDVHTTETAFAFVQLANAGLGVVSCMPLHGMWKLWTTINLMHVALRGHTESVCQHVSQIVSMHFSVLCSAHGIVNDLHTEWETPCTPALLQLHAFLCHEMWLFALRSNIPNDLTSVADFALRVLHTLMHHVISWKVSKFLNPVTSQTGSGFVWDYNDRPSHTENNHTRKDSDPNFMHQVFSNEEEEEDNDIILEASSQTWVCNHLSDMEQGIKHVLWCNAFGGSFEITRRSDLCQVLSCLDPASSIQQSFSTLITILRHVLQSGLQLTHASQNLFQSCRQVFENWDQTTKSLVGSTAWPL